MDRDPLIWPTETATPADLPPGHPDAAPAPLPALPPGYVWGLLQDGTPVPVRPAAAANSAPAVPTAPVERQGLTPGARKAVTYTVCGNFTLLSIGGVFYLVAQGVQEMQPAMPDIAHILQWGAIGLIALTVAVIALIRRGKSGPLIHKETHTYTTSASGWFSKATSNVTHNKP